MNKPIVLIVDDQYRTFRALPRLIRSEEVSFEWVPNTARGLDFLRDKKGRVRIVIIDVKSSGIGGGGFLHLARQIAPRAAVLVTGPLNSFLYHREKFFEFSGSSLLQAVNTVLEIVIRERTSDSKSGRKNSASVEQKKRYGSIIGCSRRMNEIYRLIERLKDSSATILIQGESGTGKELVAQTIHQAGRRRDQPFVPVNCGAIPANLIESELFGHERGAFTTAVSQRVGKFETARKGTLFLDEISELDKSLQVKLLRVLQEKEFQRVGGNTTIKAEARIIAAASRDLRQAVKLGHFREDLFYRLNVLPIHIPPLRERPEDIPLLLDHFFETVSREMDRPLPTITRKAQDALYQYSYPGNVRELGNIIERLVVSLPETAIDWPDLPKEVVEEIDQGLGVKNLLKELPDEGARLETLEKELIIKTLKKTSGNKQAAARMLGMTRRLLYLRLSQYGISP